MKVIFLDFDGVVNGYSALGYGLRFNIPYDNGQDGYEYFSIDRIKIIYDFIHLCLKFNYKIVVTSTWRMNRNKDIFNKFFKNTFNYKFLDNKYDFDLFIDCTKVDGKDRGEQIVDYLTNHKEITQYLVVDDNIEDILPYIPKDNILHIHPSQYGWWEEDISTIQNHFENTNEIMKKLLIDYNFTFCTKDKVWKKQFKSSNHVLSLRIKDIFNKCSFYLDLIHLTFNIKNNFNKNKKVFLNNFYDLYSIPFPEDFDKTEYNNFCNDIKRLQKVYEYEITDFEPKRKEV